MVKPSRAQFDPPRKGFIQLDGWAGRSESAVDVIGETPKRYRIRAINRTKLAGRSRWLDVGQVTLVPKRAVTFVSMFDHAGRLKIDVSDIFRGSK